MPPDVWSCFGGSPVESKPSPYCGRLDQHDEHVHGRRRLCAPGPPVITLCDRLAVEASVKRARRWEEPW